MEICGLQRGWTLLELILVTTITAVLLGVGLPAFGDFLRRQAADAAAYQVLRQLHKTRELAVLSGRDAIICTLDDAGACTHENARSLTSFFDLNRNFRVDEHETVETQVTFGQQETLWLRASGNDPALRFHHHGGANPFGSFIVCPPSTHPRLIRRISVNMAGRPYIARAAADGVTRHADGSDIDCSL